MIIRPVRPEDAEQLYKISSEKSVSRGIMGLSSDNFKGRRKLLSNLSPLDHFLVLETETPPVEICAGLLMTVTPPGSLRSIATMELMVGSQWQRQGLGRALLFAALALADNELMVERIEVEIDSQNESALKLYKSCGFKVEGLAKDWEMSPEGVYIDAYLLARCKPKIQKTKK